MSYPDTLDDLVPTTENIRYAPHLPTRMEFYENAESQDGGNAALVFIHGGSWSGKDRTLFRVRHQRGICVLKPYFLWNVSAQEVRKRRVCAFAWLIRHKWDQHCPFGRIVSIFHLVSQQGCGGCQRMQPLVLLREIGPEAKLSRVRLPDLIPECFPLRDPISFAVRVREGRLWLR